MKHPAVAQLIFLLAGTAGLGWITGRIGAERLAAQPLEAPTSVGIEAPAGLKSTAAQQWVQSLEKTAAGHWAERFEEIEMRFKEDFSQREAATLRLFGLWIAEDQAEAAAFVARKQNESLGSTFGRALGTVAPEEVQAFLSGPWPKQLGKYFQNAVRHAIAAVHPEYYLALPKSLTQSETYAEQWGIALEHLAARYPAAAAQEWSLGPTGKDSRYGQLSRILSHWIKSDREAARAWLASVEATPNGQLQAAWLRGLETVDAQAAWAEFQSNPIADPQPVNSFTGRPPTSHEEITYSLLKSLAAQDAASAVQAFLALPKPSEGLATGLASATRHLPTEPTAFITKIQELTAGAQSEAASMVMNACLAEQQKKWSNEQMVIACGLLLTDAKTGKAQRKAASMIGKLCLQDAAKGDPLLALLSPEDRTLAAHTAYNDLRPADHQAREKYFRLMEPTTMAATARNLPPTEFAPIIASLATPKYAPVQRAFAENWATLDPEGAAQWTIAQPNPAPAAEGLISKWASYDDTAASGWVAALAPGPSRDGAAAGLVAAIAGSDHEAAWQWAAHIQDAKLAAAAFGKISQVWPDAPAEFQSAVRAVTLRTPPAP